MALSALRADENHYLGTVSHEQAMRAWRELAANVGTRNQPIAEQAHVIKSFAQDCVEERWSEYTLGRAVIAWRRSNERFMPTFGQLRACVQEAGQKGGPRHYAELLESLKKRAGVAKLPKELPNASRDEKRKLFEKLKADKARGYAVRSDGRQRPWLPIDEQTLATLSRFFEGASA